MKSHSCSLSMLAVFEPILKTRLLGLLILATSSHAAQANDNIPLVSLNDTTQISEHVYFVPDQGIPAVPNVGFVVGDTATLVIDTGMGGTNGKRVLEIARQLSSSNALYLVTTHVHPEHDLGAHAFPDSTVMIRSQAQVNEIAQDGQRVADFFRSRGEAYKQLLAGAEFRTADTIFEIDYTLNLGGVEVKLFALGPNHTLGDTVIYIPSERVLFAGDVAMSALPSFVGTQSNVNHWLESLDFLASLQPKIIVPAHGVNGDIGFIQHYRDYLTQLKARVGKLKNEGKTLAQVTNIIVNELKNTYPDTSRINGAVKAAYTEAKDE